MIAHWRLRGFKSVYADTNLRLAPLTVFAGANSAGKSSVLQSILMAVQSMRGAEPEHPVQLNGPLVTLGNYEDIVSRGAESESIEIGCTIDVGGQLPIRAMCDFAFRVRSGSSRRASQLLPDLEWVRLGAGRPIAFGAPRDSPQALATVELRPAAEPVDERREKLGVEPERDGIDAMLRYEVWQFEDRLRRPRKERAVVPVGAALEHFLPRQLCFVFDSVEAEAREILRQLQTAGTESSGIVYEEEDWPDLQSEELRLNPATRTILTEVLREAAPDEPVALAMLDDLSLPLGELLERYASLPREIRDRVAGELVRRADELVSAARAGRPPRMRLGRLPLPRLLQLASDAIHEQLRLGVRYLGALREGPRSAYPLMRGSDPTDVGIHGEYTAAVLDSLGEVPISYFPPAALDEKEPTATNGPLIGAVNDWLRYLEVGSEEIQIDPVKYGYLAGGVGAGGWRHDITHFGVGLSQVLPILVMGLLAERGSTLIFEQPEVHLHPLVQARLADFFLALTWLDKQCLVETHSDHLVNGVRLRATKAEGSRVAEQALFYFVEREGGASRYRAVTVNAYGNLPSWPRGFFDQAQQTAADLLEAALQKRAAVSRERIDG